MARACGHRRARDQAVRLRRAHCLRGRRTSRVPLCVVVEAPPLGRSRRHPDASTASGVRASGVSRLTWNVVPRRTDRMTFMDEVFVGAARSPSRLVACGFSRAAAEFSGGEVPRKSVDMQSNWAASERRRFPCGRRAFRGVRSRGNRLICKVFWRRPRGKIGGCGTPFRSLWPRVRGVWPRKLVDMRTSLAAREGA